MQAILEKNDIIITTCTIHVISTNSLQNTRIDFESTYHNNFLT